MDYLSFAIFSQPQFSFIAVQNFQCADRSEIFPPSYLCDGEVDCDDGSDETMFYAGCQSNSNFINTRPMQLNCFFTDFYAVEMFQFAPWIELIPLSSNALVGEKQG